MPARAYAAVERRREVRKDMATPRVETPVSKGWRAVPRSTSSVPRVAVAATADHPRNLGSGVSSVGWRPTWPGTAAGSGSSGSVDLAWTASPSSERRSPTCSASSGSTGGACLSPTRRPCCPGSVSATTTTGQGCRGPSSWSTPAPTSPPSTRWHVDRGRPAAWPRRPEATLPGHRDGTRFSARSASATSPPPPAGHVRMLGLDRGLSRCLRATVLRRRPRPARRRGPGAGVSDAAVRRRRATGKHRTRGISRASWCWTATCLRSVARRRPSGGSPRCRCQSCSQAGACCRPSSTPRPPSLAPVPGASARNAPGGRRPLGQDRGSATGRRPQRRHRRDDQGHRTRRVVRRSLPRTRAHARETAVMAALLTVRPPATSRRTCISPTGPCRTT